MHEPLEGGGVPQETGVVMQSYLNRNAACRLFRSAFVMALTLTALVGPLEAEADVLEVPVPGLIGLYAEGVPPVSTQFSLPISPATILSASVRLRGNLPWPSYTTCGSGYNGVVFSLVVPATTGTWEAQFYVEQRFNFEVIAPLASIGGATWDFLAEAEGTVFCSGVDGPLPPECGYIHGGCCPMGEVTYASILFEYDPTVPVEVTAWGRIKALYR